MKTVACNDSRWKAANQSKTEGKDKEEEIMHVLKKQ
jgi:hypothetical protein